jgi:hypothetical protein
MWGPVSTPRIRFAVSWSLFGVEVTRGKPHKKRTSGQESEC